MVLLTGEDGEGEGQKVRRMKGHNRSTHGRIAHSVHEDHGDIEPLRTLHSPPPP